MKDLIIGKQLQELKESIQKDSCSEALKVEIILELIRTIENLERKPGLIEMCVFCKQEFGAGHYCMNCGAR